MGLPSNIEVHFFKGDPGKGQALWMYSIRHERGYRRTESGADTLIGAAVKAALELEDMSGLYTWLKSAIDKAYEAYGRK